MGWSFKPGEVHFRVGEVDYTYHMDDALLHRNIQMLRFKPGKAMNFCKKHCIDWRKDG